MQANCWASENVESINRPVTKKFVTEARCCNHRLFISNFVPVLGFWHRNQQFLMEIEMVKYLIDKAAWFRRSLPPATALDVSFSFPVDISGRPALCANGAYTSISNLRPKYLLLHVHRFLLLVSPPTPTPPTPRLRWSFFFFAACIKRGVVRFLFRKVVEKRREREREVPCNLDFTLRLGLNEITNLQTRTSPPSIIQSNEPGHPTQTTHSHNKQRREKKGSCHASNQKWRDQEAFV